ncbi:hypothetical protein B0H14DRAFT_3130249 [Mycena olivaceomarginata]|nr:hypothetical protein B0H14DRAFT_3130249 [Mycena olivaceomarginata]
MTTQCKGLSPNLTEAEVFDSASRTARLCSAFYHFAKEAHTTLWPLVKRCLVGYVICVSEEDRLLYGNRLHVYGKAVCDAHDSDPIWVRECTADGPFDVFEPELIRHALENEKINMGSLIFGPELRMVLHTNAGLSPACLSSNNAFATFYSHVSIPPEMGVSWLNPSAYKAPIQCARPPKSVNPTTKRGKPKGLTKPTPVDLCDPSTRAHALLSYIIKYTQDFTVGPLDYCGITRRIKGRGTDK